MANFYITDWFEWVEFCRQEKVNPHDFADLQTGPTRQISGGDSDTIYFIGDYPLGDKND